MTEFASTDAGAAFYAAYDAVLAKWPADTTSTDVRGEYGTTRVNVCGPEGGAPVVLLAGGGATSTVWFANVRSLSATNRVYAVDLMGDVGRSVMDGRPVRSVDDLLDWLRGVLDELQLAAPSMVGHSYGAMIALANALRAPDRVGRLVLIDPNSCFTGMRPAYLAHAVPILMRPTEKRQRAFIAWETDGARLDDDWMTLLSLGAAHFPRSKTIVPKRPSRKVLQASTVDTCVVLAGRSKVHDAAKVEAEVHRALPNARTVVIDGATHHMLPMAPARELDRILASELAAS